MPTQHTRLYEFVRKRAPNKKIMEEFAQIVGSILKKAESEKYYLTTSRIDQKRLENDVSMAIGKRDQKVILVSLSEKSERPESDISMPFWKAIEKQYGPNPLGPLYDEFIADNKEGTPWRQISKDIGECIKKSENVKKIRTFRPSLHDIIADNIRDTMLYFISFAIKGEMKNFEQIKPMLAVMTDINPIGLKKYTDDTWYVATG